MDLCNLKDSGRDADLLAFEMDNKDGFCKAPQIDSSMIVDDFSKADDSEVRNSVTPCTTPRKIDLFEKEMDFYTDKNVMECELPELVVCFKESTYHVVKDICVDEGVPSKDKILMESCKDEHKGHHIFLPSREDETSDITKEKVDIELLFPDELKSSSEKDYVRDAANVCGTKERVDVELLTLDGLKSSSEKGCDGDAANVCGAKERVDLELLTPDGSKSSSENDFYQDASSECCSEDSIQKSEPNNNAADNVADDISKKKFMHSSMLVVQVFSEQKSLRSFLEVSDYSGNEVKQVSGQISTVEPILERPAVVPATEESSKSNPTGGMFYNSKVESGAITFDFNSSTHASSSRVDKKPENADNENVLKSESVPANEDVISDSLTVASQGQHSLGESSFSAASAVSGRITYSGPIGYSGSISLRSDSSTASTRSFAFPILQPEWNSSPVRMAKADRSRFQKHRGWRQGLLCCRF